MVMAMKKHGDFMKEQLINILIEKGWIKQGDKILNYSAMLSHLQKHFREKHFLHPYIVPTQDKDLWMISNIGFTRQTLELHAKNRFIPGVREKYLNITFPSFENALEAALIECFANT